MSGPPHTACAELPAHGKRRLRAETLLQTFEELEDLAHTGSQLCKRARELQRAAPANLEEVCSFAAQLRLHAPAKLPLDAVSGLPLAPLPPGFWLPWPSLEEQIPNATALATTLQRCPPCWVALQRSQQLGAAWEVQLRPLPPATAVLFTVDGSVPRMGSKSTMQASKAPILLAEGGQVFAVAVAPGKHLSDVVTVKPPPVPEAVACEPAQDAPKKDAPKKDAPKKDAPKKDAPKKDAPQKVTVKKDAANVAAKKPAKAKKASSKSSFRNDLLLAESDDD